jgi:hypothetical protein
VLGGDIADITEKFQVRGLRVSSVHVQGDHFPSYPSRVLDTQSGRRFLET